MNDISIKEVGACGAVITAIGVGGGGCNMISHLFKTTPHKSIRLIAANTDVQALESTEANIKIKLGEGLTGGKGAGSHPDVGQRAALDTYEEIKATLEGSDIVFVSAGLGGGTGTGAAPVVAKAAKEVGAITVSIVTKPFEWEFRDKEAESGLNSLKMESDCMVVIPNDRLVSIIPKKCGTEESFKMVDNVLAHAVNSMSNVILQTGRINIDFADVRTVMSYKGLALMGIGEGNGDNAASMAVRKALESPLLDNVSVNGAMGVLVNFECEKSYPMSEIAESMGIVKSIASESDDKKVFWGLRLLDDAPEGYVCATIIATGFEREILSNDTTKKIEIEQVGEQSKNSIQFVRRASGDEYNLFNHSNIGDHHIDDYLDVPAIIRKGKD